MYSKTAQLNVLSLFNAMVVDNATDEIDTSNLEKFGVITNFKPDANQKLALAELYKPLPIRTLFGRVERDTASVLSLITKQLLHYIEVYGLNRPGLFDLEVEEGTVVSLRYVRGVTVAELEKMVQNLLYSNAPIKDSSVVENIIKEFKLSYDVNKIANNELRVLLYDVKQHAFTSGDDAVRYMVYLATSETMLIKSRKVVESMKLSKVTEAFLEKHERPLAQVFNRHKPLILAVKNKATRSVINRISRLSKTQHVPVFEPIGKRFVALALANKADASALKKVGIRDKFKMLNLLEYKMKGHDTDAFIIRNGKVHLESGRAVQDRKALEGVRGMILFSLEEDFAKLAGKKILLDKGVDYGLPVSRKQTIGNLPFGTTVTVDDGRISAGVYWENEWGARDLDLSTIDRSGHRTGWGSWSGYSKTNPVTFSGDVTSAHDGAMEFMTSTDVSYGLFVNIFSGNNGSGFELVVGTDGKDRWIKNVQIRERGKLDSRGNVIGFVDGNKLTVYQGRLNDNRWSVDNKAGAVVARGTAEFWTVGKLFDTIGIEYVTQSEEGVEYDFDLRYANFSYDKLEALLLNE